jgi:DNA helicase-2/ATP-dependent DNA helicase PcrA
MEITKEQRNVIDAKDGAYLVIALAGSGKTFCIQNRVSELIRSGVASSKILALTFTTKAATEMSHRIKNSVGDHNCTISTFHALAYKILLKYSEDIGIDNFEIVTNSVVKSKIISIFKDEMHSTINKELINDINKFIENMSNMKLENGQPKDYFEDSWVYIYKQLEKYMKVDNQITFDDLIYMVCNLFKKLPHIRNDFIKNFEYIIVDEAQDTNKIQFDFLNLLNSTNNVMIVADTNQCWEGSTISNGKMVKDIEVGDEVESYNKAKVCLKKVTNVSKSKWEYGYKITTKSGKEITLSPNHKIWSTGGNLKSKIVYLMYRYGFGFRIGTSSLEKTFQGRVSARNRLSGENADLLWIVHTSDSLEEILYHENYYSLKYGIPQVPYNLKGRKMYESYDRLFKNFGGNGDKLLHDLNMSMHYPNFCRDNYSSGKIGSNNVFVINFNSHDKKGSTLRLEIIENKTVMGIISKYLNISKANNLKSNNNRYRCIKLFSSYAEACKIKDSIIKEGIDNDIIFIVKESLSLGRRLKETRRSPTLITVSNLYEGMDVIDNNLNLDIIIKKEKVPGTFYDIEVEESHNMIGNGILSHNSIYRFQRAEVKNIFNFDKDYKPKILYLSKNFRSTQKIIDVSNRILDYSLYDEKYRKYAVSHSEEIGHTPTFCMFKDEPEQAKGVVDMIEKQMDKYEYKPQNFTILYRNNSHSLEFEKQLISRGIPFVVKGGSFINRKEVQFILACLKLGLEDYKRERMYSYTAITHGFNNNISDKIIQTVYTHDKKAGFVEVIRSAKPIPGIGKVRRNSLNELADFIDEAIMSIPSPKEYSKINCLDIIIGKILGVFKKSCPDNAEYKLREEGLKIFKEVWIDYFRKEKEKNTLKDFISNFTIKFSLDGEDVKDDDKEDISVILSTVHSYKGREREVVFVTNIKDGLFTNNPDTITADEYMDDINLFYVACSRAKHKMYLSAPMSNIVWFYKENTYSLMQIFLGTELVKNLKYYENLISRKTDFFKNYEDFYMEDKYYIKTEE